jgi:hypothetical protein
MADLMVLRKCSNSAREKPWKTHLLCLNNHMDSDNDLDLNRPELWIFSVLWHFTYCPHLPRELIMHLTVTLLCTKTEWKLYNKVLTNSWQWAHVVNTQCLQLLYASGNCWSRRWRAGATEGIIVQMWHNKSSKASHDTFTLKDRTNKLSRGESASTCCNGVEQPNRKKSRKIN